MNETLIDKAREYGRREDSQRFEGFLVAVGLLGYGNLIPLLQRAYDESGGRGR